MAISETKGRVEEMVFAARRSYASRSWES